MIAIIDYGMGNLRSVQKGFEKVGSEAVVTADPAVVGQADKVVLPGVGAFAVTLRIREPNDVTELTLVNAQGDGGGGLSIADLGGGQPASLDRPQVSDHVVSVEALRVEATTAGGDRSRRSTGRPRLGDQPASSREKCPPSRSRR